MLKIHFINVGKGNCTVIDFPNGHLTVIDTDNSRITDENDLTDPLDFLKANYPTREIFRLIITHPDMDHLSGIEELAKEFQIYNFWDTNNNKRLTQKELDESPYEAGDWNTYQIFRKSSNSPKCLFLHRNDSGEYWNTDNIRILSPSSTLIKKGNETGEYNHLSYVLMINYKGCKILLGGDTTIEAWDEIYKELGADALKANIFLAPHHGSKYNVNRDVFKYINPDYVVASVICKVDYDYNYYSELANQKVLSTKYYGNINFDISDKGLIENIYVEKNAGK
ncbi:hypothetical protein EZS27_029136 [termite gut metagenome]|uniref:Metallo-beta-lactamase domain-containing protein n=1 Tax=termite gut metagenome TaxID=433724 RepID=A0A5J4QHA5_9ZZZZ